MKYKIIILLLGLLLVSTPFASAFFPQEVIFNACKNSGGVVEEIKFNGFLSFLNYFSIHKSICSYPNLPSDTVVDTRIQLGSGAGPCRGGNDKCEERWIYFAKGVYYNCSIKTDMLNENYKNFSLSGEIIGTPDYLVSMDDILSISEKTSKPIICGKIDSEREEIINLGWNLNDAFMYSVEDIEGRYCSHEPTDYDFVFDYYNFYCCVDNYCAVYDNNVRDHIFCLCDDSLGVEPKEITCSNIKEDLPNCYEVKK